MAKYHAGKHNNPLCGARGTGNRFNVVCVDAATWNTLSDNQKCSKCVEKIKQNKAAR